MPSQPSEPVRPNPPIRRPPFRRLVQLAVPFCFLLLALPLAADEAADDRAGDRATEAPQRSETVAGLLELVQAEITEDVILLWLDTRESEKAPPSVGDLLELRNAGASDAILQKLLLLEAGETAPPAVSEPAVSTPAVSKPAVSADPEDSADIEPEPSRAEPPSRAATGDAIVDFTLSYIPEFRPDEKDWDLYVYLDGKPLSFVSRGSRVLGEQAIKFQQVLEPGPHQIRIVQENHEVDDDAESFEGHFHEARVAPVDLFFRLEAGAAEAEISFERPLLELRSAGPIAYRVAQNGRVLISQDEAGGDPDGWTPLCDDSQIRGERPPRGCRNWATFWSVDAPPRQEVLRALSLFDYRPVPKNQKVH